MRRLLFAILSILLAFTIGINFVRYTLLTSNGDEAVEPLDVFVVLDVVSQVELPVEDIFVDIGDSLKSVAKAMDGFVNALNLNNSAQGDFFSLVVGYFTGIWEVIVGVGEFVVAIVMAVVSLIVFLYKLVMVLYRLFDLLLGTNFVMA